LYVSLEDTEYCEVIANFGETGGRIGAGGKQAGYTAAQTRHFEFIEEKGKSGVVR